MVKSLRQGRSGVGVGGRRILLAGEVGRSAHLAESWLLGEALSIFFREEEAHSFGFGESVRPGGLS